MGEKTPGYSEKTQTSFNTPPSNLSLAEHVMSGLRRFVAVEAPQFKYAIFYVLVTEYAAPKITAFILG